MTAEINFDEIEAFPNTYRVNEILAVVLDTDNHDYDLPDDEFVITARAGYLGAARNLAANVVDGLQSSDDFNGVTRRLGLLCLGRFSGSVRRSTNKEVLCS